MTDVSAKDQAEAAGIEIPEGVEVPDEGLTIEAERHERKAKLAGALRIFGRFGFSEGVAGHITARDPELTDHFWVNPFGKSFRQMKMSDLILVSHEGDVVEGSGALNQAAFAIHSQIHEARPDVIAAAHSHSLYGKTFSSLAGKTVDPISQDACMFYNDVALCADEGGAIVVNTDGGAAIARAMGDKKAVVHQNHGIITVGQSVDEAAWWFIALERACQSQLLAESVGTPTHVPHEAAQFSYDQSGHSLAGWFQFQPIWEDLMAEDSAFIDQ